MDRWDELELVENDLGMIIIIVISISIYTTFGSKRMSVLKVTFFVSFFSFSNVRTFLYLAIGMRIVCCQNANVLNFPYAKRLSRLLYYNLLIYIPQEWCEEGSGGSWRFWRIRWKRVWRKKDVEPKKAVCSRATFYTFIYIIYSVLYSTYYYYYYYYTILSL